MTSRQTPVDLHTGKDGSVNKETNGARNPNCITYLSLWNTGLFALCILSPQLLLIVASLPKTSERKMEFFSLFVHPSYYHPPRSPVTDQPQGLGRRAGS